MALGLVTAPARIGFAMSTVGIGVPVTMAGVGIGVPVTMAGIGMAVPAQMAKVGIGVPIAMAGVGTHVPATATFLVAAAGLVTTMSQNAAKNKPKKTIKPEPPV